MFFVCSPTHCDECGSKLHVNSHYTRFLLSSHGTIARDVTYWFRPACKKHFHDPIIGVPGSANYSSEYYEKAILYDLLSPQLKPCLNSFYDCLCDLFPKLRT